MQLINASVSILEQSAGIDGMYKQIEIPGRVCYGSLDKICEGSAEPFVHGLEKSNHGGPMEHGAVYLYIFLSPADNEVEVYEKMRAIMFFGNDKFSHVNKVQTQTYPEYYITTNYRVLFENDHVSDLKYFCEPTKHHVPRITASFTIDRFTGEEFLRHRMGSFNRESTRYIDFIRDKFGEGSIKFIRPCWDTNNEAREICEDEWRKMCGYMSNNTDVDMMSAFDYWCFALYTAEYVYGNLRRLGWQPQQARTVLSCAIDSPLIMTANLNDWVHFFNLRAIGTTGAPHPQAKELAEPLMEMFVERGLIDVVTNDAGKREIKILHPSLNKE